MVRRIVGILAEVGRGRKSEKDISFYLNNKTNEPAKFTAPPSGLFFESVSYKGSNIKDDLISPFQTFFLKK
jgi:tRNA pseudouridine38-40 synthase